MSKVKDFLQKIPIVSQLVRWANQLVIPGFAGMTLWDLWDTYSTGLVKGAFNMRASAISYSFFMALFPFILFILNLIPFIAIDNFQADVIDFVNSLLPQQAAGAFDQIFEEIATQSNTGLLTIAFVSSLLFMTNGVSAIFNGFENSFHQEINRGFFRKFGVSLGVSLMLVLFLFVGVVLSGIVEYWVHMLHDKEIMTSSSVSVWLKILRQLSILLLLYIFVATLYFTGTKTGRQARFFSIGALLTTVLIVVVSYAYGFYIENFSNYNEIYGSIGALIILMVYIWLNSNLLLLGFELNASLIVLKARKLK